MLSLTAVVWSDWQSQLPPSLSPLENSSLSSATASNFSYLCYISISISWRVSSNSPVEGKLAMCCIWRQCYIAFNLVRRQSNLLLLRGGEGQGRAEWQYFFVRDSIFYLIRCQNFYHQDNCLVRDSIFPYNMWEQCAYTFSVSTYSRSAEFSNNISSFYFRRIATSFYRKSAFSESVVILWESYFSLASKSFTFC